jgi:predicted AAA+ superfamily ATPase
LIDRARREGRRSGLYLLLGSASLDLLQQAGESLAGRIAYRELTPFHALELADSELNRLWLRGGFPDSHLASTPSVSLNWRQDFIRTYAERDIPLLGGRVGAESVRRLWGMLAHQQGGLFNASLLARSLALDIRTINRYVDLLVQMFLLRRLQPWHANLGKRLTKSPKLYVRDSGLLHALLGLSDEETLLGHPGVGANWEGFVLENLITAAGPNASAYFYRTSAGAEIDGFARKSHIVGIHHAVDKAGHHPLGDQSSLPLDHCLQHGQGRTFRLFGVGIMPINHIIGEALNGSTILARSKKLKASDPDMA